jgi:hypothetical protein
MRRAFSAVIAVLWAASVVVAAELPFKQYNPDIDKYNFARSFITGLSYYNRVAERLASEDKAAVDAKSDARAIRDFIDDRTLDNTELRIAKNYLTRYAGSQNGLIRKVARDATVTYDKLLAMSVRERELWQVFGRFRTTGLPPDFNEEEFGGQQVILARDKKEIAKDLIRESILVGKILLSAARCDQEDCQELALTREERDKLVKKLDEFAGGNTDWGMKPGQSTVHACVAALREVLEDPLYRSEP